MNKKPRPQTVFAFEVKLLDELGLAPDLDETGLTPGAKKIAAALLAGDWESVARLKLTGEQNRDLHEWLHGFLIFTLGKLPTRAQRRVALNTR